MEVFLGGALIIAWVIVLLWAMAKTAARALRCDQFNSGLAMGLIAGAAIAAGILLFIKIRCPRSIPSARALCLL
jgi:hypothetical protein